MLVSKNVRYVFVSTVFGLVLFGLKEWRESSDFPSVEFNRTLINKDYHKTPKNHSFIHPESPDINLQNSLPGLQRRWPSVIIGGMQKCGTGAFREMLRLSPFVASNGSECHFFDRDRNYELGYDSYLEMQPLTGPNVVHFDKTPSYMSAEGIPARIKAFNPDVKLIFLLCEPVHRTLSHYLHQLATNPKVMNQGRMTYQETMVKAFSMIFNDNRPLLESLIDLSQPFTQYEELRNYVYQHIFTGEKLGHGRKTPADILLRGAYAYYLNQFYDLFPRENIKVINSNRYREFPVTVIGEVQEFMGVPVAIDEKNFVIDNSTGLTCLYGYNQEVPSCPPERKHRSNQTQISDELDAILTRFYRSFSADLAKLTTENFADWN